MCQIQITAHITQKPVDLPNKISTMGFNPRYPLGQTNQAGFPVEFVGNTVFCLM